MCHHYIFTWRGYPTYKWSFPEQAPPLAPLCRGQLHLLDAVSEAILPTASWLCSGLAGIALEWPEKATLPWAMVAAGLSRPVCPLKEAEALVEKKIQEGREGLTEPSGLGWGGRTNFLDTDDEIINLYFVWEVKTLIPHHQGVSLSPQSPYEENEAEKI